MDNCDDLFHPESVNEQVEQLLRTQDAQQGDIPPGAATLAALQRIYQEDEALLERAWARIARVEAATQTSGNVTSIVDMNHHRGKSTMYETDFSSETSGSQMPSLPLPVHSSKRPGQARARVWRTFSLLAAALAVAVIVGSMLLVIGASRNRSTATESHSPTTNTQATTLSAPAIYEGGLDELVRADAQTGKGIWRYQVPAKTDPYQIDAFMQILPAGKIVYARVGEAGGPVMAFDAATGRVLWTSKLQDIDSMALVQGTLYVGVNGTTQPDESSVYALDAGTGAQSATLYTFTGGSPQLSVVDGILYAGTDASLAAIDLVHHQQLWQKSAADFGFKPSHGPISGFIVAQGTEYVTLQDGLSSYCIALKASNGDKQWQVGPIIETSLGSGGGAGIETPVAANGMVYFAVTGKAGAVFAYDEQGHQVWNYPTGELQSTPILSGNTLYITENKIGVGVHGSGQTNLVALDAVKGNVDWRMKPVPGVGVSATVLDGIVYVATGFSQHANILYAFGASTGISLWQVHLSSDPFTLVSANAT